jgi:hypothetical protein
MTKHEVSKEKPKVIQYKKGIYRLIKTVELISGYIDVNIDSEIENARKQGIEKGRRLERKEWMGV